MSDHREYPIPRFIVDAAGSVRDLREERRREAEIRSIQEYTAQFQTIGTAEAICGVIGLIGLAAGGILYLAA